MPELGNARLYGPAVAARKQQHELVAAHARHVIVFAAPAAQRFRYQSQHFVAFQMATPVVDLFQAIQVAHRHAQRLPASVAARRLAVQPQKQRTRVWQSGKIIGGRRVFHLAEDQRVLDCQCHLAADGQQDSQVVAGKRVMLRPVKRHHSGHAADPLQRNRQRRSQRAELGGIRQIPGLHGRIAIQDGFAVFGHPAGQTFSHRYFERGEQPEVFSIDIPRDEFLFQPHVDRDRVVRNDLFQARRHYRKRFVQTQGVAQVLHQFKQQLYFLPGCGDRAQKAGFIAPGRVRRTALISGSRCRAFVDSYVCR